MAYPPTWCSATGPLQRSPSASPLAGLHELEDSPDVLVPDEQPLVLLPIPIKQAPLRLQADQGLSLDDHPSPSFVRNRLATTNPLCATRTCSRCFPRGSAVKQRTKANA